MLTKTTIALALILATTSGALAAQKRHNTNTYTNQSQQVYDTRGWHVGADPDPTVRAQLAQDPTQGN
jgi:hypothetical protein